MNIIEAMEDPRIWGDRFSGDSWLNWKVFLKALFCIPMADPELEIFRHFTGRTLPLSQPAREAYAICGMGGGKSYIATTVAVFLSVFRDYLSQLPAKAWATVMLLAADKDQAAENFSYCEGLLKGDDDNSILSERIERQTKQTIFLKNRVKIEVRAANFRRVRGRSLVAVIADETGYWETSDTSSNPDIEILRAVRPGLGRLPGSLLLAISSPYARRGALWQAYEKYHGNNESKVLVWQADTLSMYPGYSHDVIEDSYQADPVAARSDFGGAFREDLEGYINRDALYACVPSGMPEGYERPYAKGIEYRAFIDCAGGASEKGAGDSFCVAISHRDGDKGILDVVREHHPPYDPFAVSEEYSSLLKAYGITQATADAWARGYVFTNFEKHGIQMEKSKHDRSSIYLELLAYLNSGRCELLNHPRMLNQFLALQRRTGTSGKDAIDHPRKKKAHDDLSNVTGGSLLLTLEEPERRTDGQLGVYFASDLGANVQDMTPEEAQKHLEEQTQAYYRRVINEMFDED